MLYLQAEYVSRTYHKLSSQYDHGTYKKTAMINKEYTINCIHNTNVCSYLCTKM